MLTSRQICGGPARYVGISQKKWVLLSSVLSSMDIRTSLLTIIIITTASIDIHLTHMLTSRQICGVQHDTWASAARKSGSCQSVCLAPPPTLFGWGWVKYDGIVNIIKSMCAILSKWKYGRMVRNKWIQGVFIPLHLNVDSRPNLMLKFCLAPMLFA